MDFNKPPYHFSMKTQRNRRNTIQSPAKPNVPPATLPEMDTGIWSQLPEELLVLILSFLPLKIFLNLRSTCKQFKSLIYSPSFVSKHSDSSSFPSFLLLSHSQCYHHFPLYDSAIGNWRNLSVSPSVVSLLSSSTGLLCFSLPSPSSFLICNLLANSSRVIEFPAFPFTFELLSLVSTPFGYYIFMLCSRSSSSSTYVYDSRVHTWRKYAGFEPILCDNYNQEGVFFKGCLYFTTPEPFSVVCFDFETGKWRRSETELPVGLTFARLVGDGEGKLYLIGGIGRNGISRSMKIWELGEERKWVEMERLPELMCQKFVSVCYHNYHHVYCFWHKGLICICCYTWPEILYFKLSRGTWHWLPKCPSLPEKWSCGFRWFSFVPELYALV
ncbi:hypothetical protein UlMin_035382 [Ulmus minor]